ncbi:MAG: hypothetical protein IKK29_06770, partial [Christensenellaceae bacterium]|nr:hypothetical protein [Christensenellaceae bacterium]
MERLNGRYIVLLSLILALFLFLGGAYLSLVLSAETVIDEEGNEIIPTTTMREIEVEGKRGSILD